jgi:hypothetical protein
MSTSPTAALLRHYAMPPPPWNVSLGNADEISGPIVTKPVAAQPPETGRR